MASKGKAAKPAPKKDENPHDRMEEPLDEQELESLYAWVDSIPLSRPKRNISRDFSDGGNLKFCFELHVVVCYCQIERAYDLW